MGEIVNLNRARKDRAKAEDKARASANRVAFGRTKAERQIAAKEKERTEKALDGQKLDRQTPED